MVDLSECITKKMHPKEEKKLELQAKHESFDVHINVPTVDLKICRRKQIQIRMYCTYIGKGI